ncbi:hypothetical protein [Nocardioides plantarum]|uniref:Uncharacterized protein n=1 Tax=Nocardioides plantarum TaxID=29299 RepID=A0ABV5K9T3_9ACTN|nr:hypothetical protein [Nocardioides plantarum]
MPARRLDSVTFTVVVTVAVVLGALVMLAVPGPSVAMPRQVVPTA